METLEQISPSSYQLTMLIAIQRKPIYQGTVPKAEIKRRRAANKRARAQRKTNARLDKTQ